MPVLVTLLAVAGILATAGCLSGGDKPSRKTGEDAPRRTATPTPGDAAIETPRPVATLGAVFGEQLYGAGSPEVYLLPLDDFPHELAQQLQAFFRDEQGIAVGVLPGVALSDEVVDFEREQVIADRLIEAIEAERPPEAAGMAIIGLTEHDMYMLQKPEWAWVFSLRDESRRIAVVSTARMDERNYGQPPNAQLLRERAEKMVGKNVGVLYLGLPATEDPRSVMFNDITSLFALDYIDEDFRLR
jgi:predicted Zn-dependent protease